MKLTELRELAGLPLTEASAKIEIWVDDDYWTGKGLSDEAPDAKLYKDEDSAMKDVLSIKKKYPNATIKLAFNAGTNKEELVKV